ncbi:MAG: AzlC family ABC transporter permease [Granulosicoccus sp.]|nr:AzlC family ABC transporter permease [Granulosicoccus sp.]
MTSTRTREFWNGARDSLPVIIGSIPFGVIFGALAINAGLSVAATLGMSLIVFAGSAQFVAAGLIAQGAGLIVIVFTTFVVNLRHALYAASLGPYLKGKPQRWLLPLGFWLTDETYAVVVQRYANADQSVNKHWYHLGSSVAMYVNWQICTVAGLLAGAQLQGMTDWGLEFAMVVTFIGIIVPMLTTIPMISCALIAGLCAMLLRDLPHQIGLMLGSLAGITLAMLLARMTSKSDRDPLVT